MREFITIGLLILCLISCGPSTSVEVNKLLEEGGVFKPATTMNDEIKSQILSTSDSLMIEMDYDLAILASNILENKTLYAVKYDVKVPERLGGGATIYFTKDELELVKIIRYQ